MDDRPIGIFDSGLGGLTALKALGEALPGEDIVYFGDSARMPYGGYDRGTLVRYAAQNASFLVSKGVKAIIVACGTVSSNCIEEVAAKFDVPFVGVLSECCRRAAEATRNGKIAVIATEATIKSGRFAAEIASHNPDAEITSRACPSLAPLVESGHFRRGDPEAVRAIESELAQVRESGADTLLLACTHYPLLSEVIEDWLGRDVRLISSGAEAVREMKGLLEARGLLSGRSRGRYEYYTSGDPAAFSACAEIFLSHPVRAEKHEMNVYRKGKNEHD